MMHVLVIAGLDPSGGAGILSDVTVARAHGVRPVGVITATTVQDTTGVRAVHPVGAEVVGDQLAALCSDVELGAVKIGMLADEPTAMAVAGALAQTAAPVVWDPVLSPTRGGVALYGGDPAVALAALAPHLALLTPNAGEAAALAGIPVASASDMARAGAILAERTGAAVLVKGGHAATEGADDVLVTAAGTEHWFRAPRHPGGDAVHGTGCALATAIACGLAGGADLEAAIGAAKAWIRERMVMAEKPGRGAAAIV
ncbi:MAG TPA: hydroxymethylpyrimidine/phosphomethylpyrimidine kinase [Kofleriaceae bacterium]|nr:hydroxymethylpyrimidine/phosphomethylpyrimidine kinase [Kofleriaceae bacterium]